MRQVGAKSRGLGDVAWPNYVPAALLRGSGRRYDGRDEAAGADIKPLVDLVIPIGESPAVWLISGRRSLKLERFHDDAPAWSAADSTAAMGHGTLDKAARRTPGRAVSFHIDWYGPGGHGTPARCAVDA